MACSPVQRISFDVPQDWVDVSVLAFTAASAEGFAPNVVVNSDPVEGGTLADYVTEHCQDLQDVYKNYRQKNRTEETHSGIKGEVVEHRFSEDGIAVRQRQFHFVQDDTVYTVSVTFEEKRAENLQKVFSQVVDNIRFAGGSW